MFYITLNHDDSNKQDSLPAVSICVSTLACDAMPDYTCLKCVYPNQFTEFMDALTSLLRYCKHIANLLFWQFWACLTMAIKNNSINLYKILKFICTQKINFISYIFLEILKKDIANLLFWMLCLIKHTQNFGINM